MAACLFWNEPLDTVLENAYCVLSGDTRQRRPEPLVHTACVARATRSASCQLLDDPLKDLGCPKEDCNY